VSGSTTLANVTIAGEQVTVTANGIQAVGKSAPLSLPISALNSLLKELGITMAVTNATDTVSGASAARTLDGLQISVNLDTLDNAANKVAGLLPPKLTSSLPIALPNQQVITLDLGTVTVSSAASPSFVADDSGSSSSDTGSSPSALGSISSPSDLGSTFTPGTTGSSFTGGGTTPTGSSTSPTSGGTGSTGGAPTSAISPIFKGIGSLLVLLGVLAALAMAYAYKRADDATELLGTACADGDPLGARFSDDDADAGGFA